MMTVRTISRLVGVLALSAVASAWMGCSSTPDEEKGATDTGSEFREAPTPPDSGDQMGGKLAGFQTVYFDYDRAEIREDAPPARPAQARWNTGRIHARVLALRPRRDPRRRAPRAALERGQAQRGQPRHR